MRSLKFVAGALILGGVVVALIYPQQTMSAVRPFIDSIRWIKHEAVPRIL